jgi:ABC-type glycerol-3-phosphate transport system substrate-binding protein
MAEAAAIAKDGFQKAALGILSVQQAMDEIAKEWEKMLQKK